MVGIKRDGLSAVLQFGESGGVLEQIRLNFSDSIDSQISEENERIHSFMQSSLHLSSLTDIQVERDFGKNSIQWRKSRYRSDIYKYMRGWR